jgi:phosphoglycerate dehydrogenase-like enzyme
MAGRTLGILGLGNIGGAVAKIGNAFGMKVIAWSHNLTTEHAADAGATLVSKGELFQDADVGGRASSGAHSVVVVPLLRNDSQIVR